MATIIRKAIISVSNIIEPCFIVCFQIIDFSITSFLLQLAGLFQQGVQLLFCLQDGWLQLLFAGLVAFGVRDAQAVEFSFSSLICLFKATTFS